MKGDSIVSSLVSSYGLEWRSNQKQQNRQQSQKQPNTNSVRKGTNTTLSGNQGSPQPGAPKSHSVSRTGNKTYRIGAIQKLAMAMPCSKWKGDTKHSETECETELWREGNGCVSTTALRVLSDSAQMSFSKHHRHWKLQNALVVHPAFKTEPNAIKLANRQLDSKDADLQA